MRYYWNKYRQIGSHDAFQPCCPLLMFSCAMLLFLSLGNGFSDVSDCVTSRLSGHVARVVPDFFGSVVGVIARGIPHHWHRHGFAIARGAGISQSESRLWFKLIQCLLIAWLGCGSCWKAMMFNDFRRTPRFCHYKCGRINLVVNALTSGLFFPCRNFLFMFVEALVNRLCITTFHLTFIFYYGALYVIFSWIFFSFYHFFFYFFIDWRYSLVLMGSLAALVFFNENLVPLA